MDASQQPLVSVFIVTYNSSDYIIEALDSVKTQTYPNIELIVSDDCSTDNTLSLVKDWMNSYGSRFVRTELVVAPVNQGIPANYNRAVGACQGEWIKMMDGDDLLLDDCISANMEYVQQHPEVQVVFSDLNCFRDNDTENVTRQYFTKKDKSFFSLDSDDQMKWLLRSNVLPSQTCFMKTKLLKDNPYNEKYRLLEDYPMWLHLSKFGIHYYFMDKCTALYRESESVSSSKKTFFPPAYTEFCRQFFYDEKLPLIRKYGLKDAYNFNRRYFLWYDVCNAVLGNKKNWLTNCFYWIFGAVIFKLLSFKL